MLQSGCSIVKARFDLGSGVLTDQRMSFGISTKRLWPVRRQSSAHRPLWYLPVNHDLHHAAMPDERCTLLQADLARRDITINEVGARRWCCRPFRRSTRKPNLNDDRRWSRRPPPLRERPDCGYDRACAASCLVGGVRQDLRGCRGKT